MRMFLILTTGWLETPFGDDAGHEAFTSMTPALNFRMSMMVQRTIGLQLSFWGIASKDLVFFTLDEEVTTAAVAKVWAVPSYCK
jgi:hypothetical protein